MGKSLIILLALAASVANAGDAIARRGDDWIRLFSRTCTNQAIVGFVTGRGGNPADFRAAEGNIHQHQWIACWIRIPGGVLVVFEDGDQGTIRDEELQQVPEV